MAATRYTGTRNGDRLSARTSGDTLEGLAGNDILNSGTTSLSGVWLSGGDGNDTLIAKTGDALIDGGAGIDTAQFSTSVAAVDLTDAKLVGVEKVLLVNTSSAGYDFSVQTEGLDITGSRVVDDITGGRGNDTITGGLGADKLRGGDGDDVLVAEATDALISGGAGADTVRFAAAVARSSGGVAQLLDVDLVDTDNRLDIVITNTGNAVYDFADQSEVLHIAGGRGKDTITGGQAADTLSGGAGNDLLFASVTDALVDGGAGNDTVTYGTAVTDLTDAELVNVEYVLISLTGNAVYNFGNQTEGLDIMGNSGQDTIYGGNGADALRGGLGDDQLHAGDNDKLIDGGKGNDTAFFASSVSAKNLMDSDLINVEAIQITGTGSYDFSSQSERLAISAAAASGAVTLTGGKGVDTLTGGGGNDVIAASDLDVIDGAGGINTVRFAAGVSKANLEDGDLQQIRNIVITNARAATYDFSGQGSSEVFNITGSNGNDIIITRAGVADDTLSGGAGNDVLVADDTDALIDGGSGTADVAQFGAAVSTSLTDEELANVEYVWIGNTLTDQTYDFSLQTESLQIVGNSRADLIRGGYRADTITGGEGADVLYGNQGADLLVADTSDVLINGGDGDDTVRFTAAVAAGHGAGWLIGVENVVITNTGSASYDFSDQVDALNISSNSGNDTLTGGLAADTLSAGAGDDLLVAQGTDALVDGGAGTDTVRFASYVTAALGNAQLVNVERIEITDTGAGRYDFSVQSEALAIVGNAGDDTVLGGAGNESISGQDGADSLSGGAGSDTLFGSSGDDTLSGGEGADSLIGGDGDDILVAQDIDAKIDGSSDYSQSGGAGDTAQFDAGVTALNLTDAKLVGIERVEITNSNDASYDFSAQTEALSIMGGDANDTIVGTQDWDYIDGGNGDDMLTGGAGNDLFLVSAGSDTIADLTTGDVLIVRSGATATAIDVAAFVATDAMANEGTMIINAVATGSAIDLSLASGPGGFQVNGGAGVDVVMGSRFNDTLTGGAGADSLAGGDGANLYRYGAGEFEVDETLTGGAGRDTVLFTADSQTVEDAAFANKTGIEAITLGNGTNSLTLGTLAASATADLTVTGGTGADQIDASALGESVTVNAGNGDNLVTGSSAADKLTAGSGDDTLTGGAGADSLVGGDGANVYRYGAGEFEADETLTGGAGRDTVLFTADSQTVADAAFANKTGIEAITLGNGTNSLTLGPLVASATAGLTVTGGSGSDQIDASALGEAFTVNAGNGDNLVRGSSAGDILTTGSGNDTLIGGAGADSLSGGSGDDLFIVDSATDGGVAETYDGGAGTDTLRVTGTTPLNLSDDTLTGIEVLDLIKTAAGAAASDDQVVQLTDAQVDALSTIDASGGDRIELQDAMTADMLDGTVVNGTLTLKLKDVAGNALTLMEAVMDAAGDQLVVDGSALTGAHALTFVGAAETTAKVSVTGGAGDDVLTGTSGADTLTGGAGADIITGGAGVDSLAGGDGVNLYRYGAGEFVAAETLTGGSGRDTVVFTADGQTVADAAFANKTGIEAITTAGGTNSLTLGTLAASATAGLTVTGGAGADQIDASALGEAVNIAGNAGANVLTGSNQGDTITGGADADTITGGAGADVLTGGDGANTYQFGDSEFIAGDSIMGGTGTDTVLFTADSQTLVDADFANKTGIEAITTANGTNSLTLGTTAATTTGSLTVTGGTGADQIDASALGESVTVNAGNGDNLVTGSSAADKLSADSGNDTLTGGAGADSLVGGDGANLYRYGAGEFVADETLTGGAGRDTVLFTADGQTVEDAAFANKTGIEAITLGNGTNSLTLGPLAASATAGLTVTGGTGADQINASALGEALTVNAGNGNDIITGGAGPDSLDGGEGDDAFRFASSAGLNADATVIGGIGTDTIEITMADTALVDADFDHVNGVEVLTLTGASTAVLAAYASAAGIVSVNTGTDHTALTSSMSTLLSVNAEALADGQVLTLSGTGAVTVTGLSADLVATTATGAVMVTAVDDASIATGVGATTITQASGKTAQVNAEALADDTLLTTQGAGNFTVTNLLGNLANEATGTVSVTLDDDDGTVSTTVANNAASGTLTVNSGSFDAGDTIVLAGSQAIAVVATDSVAITTGSVNASVSEVTGKTATVNATALADNNTLTISGAGNFTITGLQADLTSTAAGGAVNITTADVATQTIALGTGTSGTRTVDATAMTDGDLLTLTGAGALTLSSDDADVNASAYTGAISATVAGTAAANYTLGTVSSSIASTNSGGLTVDAEALADNQVLTISGTGAFTVSNLAADLTSTATGTVGVTLDDDDGTVSTTVTNNAASGTLTVNSGSFDSGDTIVLAGSQAIAVVATDSVAVTTGTASASISEVTGKTAMVNATAMADGGTLTLSGEGGFTITGLQADLASTAAGGAVNITTADVSTQTIALGSGTTGTRTVNAMVMTDNDLLTLSGAGSLTLISDDADVDASAYTGAITATVSGTYAAAYTLGTASFNLASTNSAFLSVNAEAMADGQVLTLSGTGAVTVDNLLADLTSTSTGTVAVTLDDDDASGMNATITNNATSGTLTVNSGSFDSDDRIVLAGSRAISVVATDSVAITTGTASSSVSEVTTKTATIDATSMATSGTLTLSGAGGFSVTGLQSNLSSSADGGALNVTTADAVGTVLDFGAGTTGTRTVTAIAVADNHMLYLKGSGALTLSSSNGDMNAWDYAGAISATVTNTAAAQFEIGAGTTSITANGSAALTIDADSGGNTAGALTIKGAATGDVLVTGAETSVTMDNGFTGSGLVSVTTADVTTLTVALGTSTTGTRAVNATAMTDGDVLTLTGSDDVAITSTNADINASAFVGAITATVTNTADATLQIGAANATVTAAGNDAAKTLMIDAAVNTANTLTIADAGAKAGDITVTNANSVVTLANAFTGTGDVTVVTADDAAVTVNFGTSTTGTRTVNATAMTDGDVLTLTGTDAASVTLVAGDLTANAYVGNLTVTASTGTNVITTGSGDDAITGGAGVDSLSGGSGDDTFKIAALADIDGLAEQIYGGTSGADSGTDSLTFEVAGTADISSATISGIEALNLNSGSNALTLTRAQHEAFSTVNATGTADSFTVKGNGAVTTKLAIETYSIGDDSTDSRTVTVSAAGQGVTANSTTDAVTFDIGALVFTGTLTGDATIDDKLKLATGASIVAATISGIEDLELASGASVTMTQAQNNAFTAADSTITAAGSETINIAAGDLTTVTGLSNIESYVLGDDTSGNAVTFTVNAAGQSVTASSTTDAVTFDIGTLTYTGTLTGDGTVNDKLKMGDGANIKDATLSGIEDLEIVNGGSVTMTAAQYNAFSGTVTANAGETINLTTALTGAATLYAAVENFNLAAGNNSVTSGKDNQWIKTAMTDGQVLTLSTAFKTTVQLKHADLDASSSTGSIVVYGYGDGEQEDGNSYQTGSGDDTLIGAGGADNLIGGSGNDVFIVSAVGQYLPGDTINGGAGNDLIRFTSTNAGDTLTLNSNLVDSDNTIAVVIGAELGQPTAFNVNASAVTLTGGVSITGNNDANALTGSAYADTITGGAGVDSLSGGSGDDTLKIAALADIDGLAEQIYGGTSGADSGTDSLTFEVAGTADISSATISGIETLNLHAGSNALTLTRAQHDGFSTVNATGTADSFTVSGDGAVTTKSAIETYSIGDDSTDSRTVTVSAAGQGVTANSTTDAVTFDIGALVFTGTLTGDATIDDKLKLATGASIAAATITGIEDLELASGASVTMTQAQNNAFTATDSTITAVGGETINIAAGDLTTVTGVSNIESYVMGDDTSDNAVAFTVNAAGQGVTASSTTDAVTFDIGTMTYTGTLTGDGTVNDKLKMGDGANIKDATLSGIEDLEIANNASVTMTADQYKAFSGTVTANATEWINLTTTLTAGETLKNNVEFFVLANGDNSVSTGKNYQTIWTSMSDNQMLTLSASHNVTVWLPTADIDARLSTGNIDVDGIGSTTGTSWYRTGSGNDTLHGGNAADTLSGGLGNDVFIISMAAEYESSDYIDGGAGSDVIRFTSTTENDTLTLNSYVADSDNTIAVALSDKWGGGTSTALNVNAAAVGLTGGVSITGNDGDNALTGSGYADAINGGSGADSITGGAGVDSLVGGDGNDVFLYAAEADLEDGTGLVDATISGGNDTDRISVAGGLTVADTVSWAKASSIEELYVTGTAASSIDLDQTAQMAGIATINIATSTTNGNLVDVSEYTSLGVTIEGSTSATNSLKGGEANDTITGGSADDTITGGVGADSMLGGSGNDRFEFDIGRAGFNPGADVTVDGSDGTDTLYLWRGDANAVAVADAEFAKVANMEGLILSTNLGVTSVTLGAYANAAFASGIAVSQALGSAMKVDGSDAAFTRTINATGGAGNDTLIGGSKVDTLSGGAGNDVVTGGIGGDAITGGDGADTFVYSLGDSYEATVGGMSMLDNVTGFTTGTDKFQFALSGSNVNVWMGPTASALTGSQNGYWVYDTTNDAIRINAGSDNISNANAYVVDINEDIVVNETDVHFVITGTTGNDSLTGGAGNDTIMGGAANDSLTGGAGTDTFYIDGGTDSVTDLSGSDVLVVSASAIVFASVTADFTATASTSNAGAANLNLSNGVKVDLHLATGTAGYNISADNNSAASIIVGSDFADTIKGGNLGDTIYGGVGDDTIYGGFGADQIDTGTGINTIVVGGNGALVAGESYTGGGTDTLSLSGESGGSPDFTGVSVIDSIETILFAEGVDATFDALALTSDTIAINGTGDNGGETLKINGSSLSDVINLGGLSLDINDISGITIDAKDGGDTVTGTNGADSITLGAGNDVMVFSHLTGSDTITDYSVADDSIQLSKATFAALGAVGALSSAEFVSGASVVAGADADDRLAYNTTTGALYYDADGNGAGTAVLIGTFTGAPTLVVGEFSIVA